MARPRPTVNANNLKQTPIPVVSRQMPLVNPDGTVTRSGQLLLEQLQPVGPQTAIGATIVGFDINDATAGVNVGPMLVSPGDGSVSKCVAVVKASDPAVALAFTIRKNGTSVFGSATIPAGAASASVHTVWELSSGTLSIKAGDVFSIDVTAGSENWAFTTQLEP